MRDLLTPKQIARALDVSESSVKRWCDKGVIPTQYTAGGHRRITLAAIRTFLRQHRQALVYPEALGLPSTCGRTERGVERAAERLSEALLQGDEHRCRQIVLDLYLAEHSLSTLCDQVLAVAFRKIGERWEAGGAEIYQERRSCEITLRLLHELRGFLPVPAPDAPLALGGAPSGDQYNLCTTMAELVLREAGWQGSSLGDNLPFATLAAALETHRPQLFWLSCSHIADERQFVTEFAALFDRFGSTVPFVIGGGALTPDLRHLLPCYACCDRMQQLEEVAARLHPPLLAPPWAGSP